MIDIVPGDVVVCVDDSPLRFGALLPALKRGALYRVSKVWAYPRQPDAHVLVNGLQPVQVPGYKSPSGYGSDRFRKVKKADTDFTEYMRKMRPAEKRVDA